MTQMDDDSDDANMEAGNYRKTIGYRLQHAARLHRTAIARGLAELGLYPGQEQALKHLQDVGHETIGGLALALHVRPPTVSKTIARLTQQGLIERQDQAGDARVVMVSLTPLGREKAAALDAIWFAIERQMCEGLEPRDIKRVRKGLRRIERQLSPGDEGADAGDADLG